VDAALTERKPLNIIITGATTGAGPNVVRRLVKAGHTVGAVANTTVGASHLRELGALPVFVDETRAAEVASLVKLMKADVVVDLGSGEANQTVVNLGWNPDILAGRAAAIAEAAKSGGALLVQVSHAFVYGDHGSHDDHDSHGHGHHTPSLLDETTKPSTGGHPLLKAVVKAEKAALNVGGVVLRAGYGYGASYTGLQQASAALKTGGSVLSGDGVVNYLYADDLGEAIRRAAEAKPAGEIFNVSDGAPITCHGFLRVLATEHGVNPPGKQSSLFGMFGGGKPLTDLLALSAPVSTEKIKTVLGFVPAYTLSAGFADMLLTWRAAEVQ
jgi:nucleoside-diphosphate-sugar epimerase